MLHTDPLETDERISTESSHTAEYRFELTVEGMTCVRCTAKVEKTLKAMEIPISNLKIDFITNRLLVTLQNKEDVNTIINKLNEIGYPVKDSKDITQTVSSQMRILTLQVQKGDREIIKNTLYSKENRLLAREPIYFGNKCTITYNPIQVRGGELIKKLHETHEYTDGLFQFSIENPFNENVNKIKFSDFGGKQLLIVVAINFFNVVLSFTPEHNMLAPNHFGMFSYYLIAVLFLTFLNLKFVGFEIYATSFKQLVKSFNVNMMTLVSIGSGISLVFGFIYTFLGIAKMVTGGNHGLHMLVMNAGHMFHTSAAIFTSLVVGKFIEGKIKKRIYSKIDDLKSKLQVNVHNIQRVVPKNMKFDILSTEELEPLLIEKDDYIKVQGQSMIPFDGFIEKGTLKVVENIQYGWEKVETKTKGHPIMSGTQVIEVQEDTILRVTEPLEKTLAGRLFYEIKEAASGSSSERNKGADIIASVTKYFITVVFILAMITFLGWCLILVVDAGSISYAYPFEKFIAVLVASCPCALGIAIPMVYAIALRKGFKSGALIKDTSSLDILQKIDTVIFDKTGTITGTFNVKEVQNLTNKYDDESLWEIVSLVEKDHLQHPIGLALFQEAIQRLTNVEKLNNVITRSENKRELHEYFASEGIIEKGISIDEHNVQVALGNHNLLKRLQITPTRNHISVQMEESESRITNDTFSKPLENEKKDHEIHLYLCIDNEAQLLINLSLEETAKRNVSEVMSFLRQKNKDIYILSGDNKKNAYQIGEQLGIPRSHIKAEICPEGKEKFVKELVEKRKKRVMMVGDGLNDIKAFKAADLGCAINFKSSQNLTHSDFIIINNDLETLKYLFNLAIIAGRFKKVILICSLIYNIPVILAASGVLKSTYGIDLEAYFACWTMVLFSMFLALVANIMELINLKDSVMQKPKFTGLLGLVGSALKSGITKNYELAKRPGFRKLQEDEEHK